MKKIILAGLLALSCLGGFASLSSVGRDTVCVGVDKNYVDESDVCFVQNMKKEVFSAEKREKPKFEAYTELPNEDFDGKYKFYFFSVGEVSGVPVSISESFFYNVNVTVKESFSIEMQQESGFQSSMEYAIEKSSNYSERVGYVITKGEENSETKTSDYTYGSEASASASVSVENTLTVGASVEAGSDLFGKASAKAEETIGIGATVGAALSSHNTTAWGEAFSATNSVEIANAYDATVDIHESTSIRNGYSYYESSGYRESKTTEITFDSSSNRGYYRYGVFSICELEYILCVDTKNMKVYTKYYLYPKYFSRGLDYSSDGRFDKKLEEKLTVDLNDVVDYLNYKPAKEEYQYIKFESNGGTDVPMQTVEMGEKITKPEDPTRFGYSFAGWYTDEKLTKSFDFATEVTEYLTLYAKWDCNLSVECLSYYIDEMTLTHQFGLGYDGIYLQLKVTNNCSYKLKGVQLSSFDLYIDDLYLGREIGNPLHIDRLGSALSAGQSIEISFGCYYISAQYKKLVSHLGTQHEFRLENINFSQAIELPFKPNF